MKSKKGVAKAKKNAKPVKVSKAAEKKFLSVAKKIVDKSEPPWEQRRIGRPGTSPATLVLCVLFRHKFELSYRQVTARLQQNKDLLKILGLKTAPSKSTIGVAAKKVSDAYIKRISRNIARSV